MRRNEFIGQIQYRARLSSREDAVEAARATLATLTELLLAREVDRLAGGMPEGAAAFARLSEGIDGLLSLDDFFARVAERERVELPQAVAHSRAVVGVLVDNAQPDDVEELLAQLPDEYLALFTDEPGHKDGAA